jgi:hypothetical protein
MSHWTSTDFGDENFGSTTSTDPRIMEFSSKISELTSLQRRVDAGLNRMPEGPEKQRLMKLREESRGIFTRYILPAWEQIKSFVGNTFSGEDMGILPLIPIAAVAAATAALGYVGNSIIKEQRILSDPSFTAAQKTQLLTSSGIASTVSQGLSSVKNIVIIGAIGFIGWQIFKMTRKES